jgi:N-acetylmuramoyl-L-alanine amidase
MLTGLADIARKAGLTVVEVPGWETRGHGPMSDVRTVTNHHTANGGAAGDAPSLRVVRDGRPGLAGPLAHLVVGRTGTVYVVAAGLCWHAGASLHPDFTNAHAIGIEAEAAGDGRDTDWPPAQTLALARLNAALIRHHGLDVADARGHKETCAPAGRKIDPSFDMSVFRRTVARADLTQPITEATVAKLDPDDYDAIAKAVLHGKTLTNLGSDQKVSLAQLMEDVERTQDADTKRLAALEAAAGQGGVDVDKLAAALAPLVLDALAARLAS